jgi:hypothetical protein
LQVYSVQRKYQLIHGLYRPYIYRPKNKRKYYFYNSMLLFPTVSAKSCY